MPIIRDLGINVIPYHLSPQGGDDEFNCTLNTCINGSLHHCDSPSPADPGGPQDDPNCPPPSPNCPQHTKKHNHANASGLTPGAIEQLRQQMRTELHP